MTAMAVRDATAGMNQMWRKRLPARKATNTSGRYLADACAIMLSLLD